MAVMAAMSSSYGRRNVNTLVDFRYRRLFKAKPGGKGQGSNKFGRDADDDPVRVGTIVRDEASNALLADLAIAGHRQRRPRALQFTSVPANRHRHLPNGANRGKNAGCVWNSRCWPT